MRTCDGFYFPISYSTTPANFPQDEQVCQRMCPAAEVALYSHRNPGEDISQAISTGGRTYSELPNAFAFRKAFNPSCSCRAPGQTWADALKHLEDNTLEQGDIVVTEEQAKLLSQPRDSSAARALPLQRQGRAAEGRARCADADRLRRRRSNRTAKAASAGAHRRPALPAGELTRLPRRAVDATTSIRHARSDAHHSVMCMMNLSRFGIFTFGSVWASMTSVSPMISLM